ncbi:integrator complex subunit 8-like [Orbicella faveolata]|uniref:integrator complex subunit 8-like n=1 Tax=Orbicella faveolata TaxID=48498 RepID=UPI0009E62C83|nr:integrator complex subunit 8-like [Orbicella faveolata]
MVLPTAPSLLSDPKKTDKTEPEKASSEVGPTSEEGAQSVDVDITDDDKAKSEGDAKNGSDDCNGSNAVEKMDTTTEEIFTVKKEDIIAQVSFDLGTLYFYQEKFQQAMKLFESCKNAQCCQSSFYTVNEQRLSGYYMACCGLTGIPPVLTSAPPLAATKPSLAVRFEQSRHSGYNDIIVVLLEDNITFELPLEYRKNLVSELRTHSRRMSEDEESATNIPLDWQIMVCNIIRDVLEGRPANPGFWLSLENCSQAQLEMIFSLCLQSIPVEEDFPSQGIKESNRFKVMKSFVQ